MSESDTKKARKTPLRLKQADTVRLWKWVEGQEELCRAPGKDTEDVRLAAEEALGISLAGSSVRKAVLAAFPDLANTPRVAEVDPAADVAKYEATLERLDEQRARIIDLENAVINHKEFGVNLSTALFNQATSIETLEQRVKTLEAYMYANSRVYGCPQDLPPLPRQIGGVETEKPPGIVVTCGGGYLDNPPSQS